MTKGNMTRRALLSHASLVAASALAAPALIGTAKGQTRELRMGTPFVNGSNLHQAMQKFAEVVSAQSNGKFKVNVYSDSQIGDIQALLSGMQLGTIDMAYLGIGNGAALKGGGPLNVAYTPYLFKSKEWAEKILNGPLFAPMFEGLAKESGVRVFAAAGARSGRAIQTTKGPINVPDDLKGFRLRIPPIPMFKDAFRGTRRQGGPDGSFGRVPRPVTRTGGRAGQRLRSVAVVQVARGCEVLVGDRPLLRARDLVHVGQAVAAARRR